MTEATGNGTTIKLHVTIPGEPELVVPAVLEAIRETFADTPKFYSVKASATTTFRYRIAGGDE